jgi:hypothetical protein
MVPSTLLDLFFPTPRRVIVVWEEEYGVGDLNAVAPEGGPLPMALRKMSRANWQPAFPVRWQIGARGGLAIANASNGLLRHVGTHMAQTEPEVSLPEGLKLWVEKPWLYICGQMKRNEFRFNLNHKILQITFVFRPGADESLWGGTWTARFFTPDGLQVDVDAWHTRTGVKTYRLVVPYPDDRDVRSERQMALISPLAVGPGVLAVLVPPRQIWAAHMGQEALHLITEEERGVLKAIALSPKGRYLVALRRERDRAAWLGWRWDGRTFLPAWEVEMPPLPEEGDVRISPDLRWIVLVGSRVWAIPTPYTPLRSRPAKTVREAVRKIFPVEAPHAPHDAERSS